MTLNLCQFIGNCGKDPEIRSAQDGKEIANLSIGVSEKWKDKASGEQKEKTEWVKVVIFNKNLVELVKKYVVKGSKIYVSGKLQTRKWQDKEGADRYSTEVVLSDFNGQIELLSPKGNSEPSAYDQAKQDAYQPSTDDQNIPF